MASPTTKHQRCGLVVRALRYEPEPFARVGIWLMGLLFVMLMSPLWL